MADKYVCLHITNGYDMLFGYEKLSTYSTKDNVIVYSSPLHILPRIW